MGPHIAMKCTVYTEYEPNNVLCVKRTQEGKQKVFGFHSQANCKHQAHEQHAFVTNGPSKQQSVQNPRQDRQDNSTWRVLKRN